MKAKILLLAVLAIFAPIKGAIIAVGVLTFSDLILGIIAAKKRGEKITSGKLRQTVSKLVIFEVCLLLAFITEFYLLGSLLPISKIAAAYIGIVEFQSIVENLNEINGSPVFTRLIKLLNKKAEEEDTNLPPDAK